MKQSFKKVVSILLVAMLLVSVFPAMFVTTASATTWADLGIYSNSGQTVVPDPVDGIEDVIMSGNQQDSTAQLLLADPANPSQPFVPVAGTEYTLSFSYYIVEEGGARVGDFYLSKGNGLYPQADGRVPYTEGYSVAAEESKAGQWVETAIVFTDETIMSKNTAETELKYLILNSYHSKTGKSTFYIKDIEIHVGKVVIVEHEDVNFTLDPKTAIKTTDEGVTYVRTDTGSTDKYTYGMTDGYMTISGNNIATKSSEATAGWIHCFRPSDGYDKKLAAGRTYTVSFNYKALAINAGNIELGVAACTTGAAATGGNANWGYTFRNNFIITEVSADWESYSITFTAPADSWLSIGVFLGSDRTGVINSIMFGEITVTSINDKTIDLSGDAVELTMNDNGDVYTYYTWKGEDLPEIAVNADNAALGETRIGWYENAQFRKDDVAVAAVPAGTDHKAVLYARYPTTIIDYDHIDPGSSDSSGALSTILWNFTAAKNYISCEDGVLKMMSDSGGYRFNGYDAEGLDAMGFVFQDGVKYNIKIWYQTDNTTQNYVEVFPLKGNAWYTETSYTDPYNGVSGRKPCTSATTKIARVDFPTVPVTEPDNIDDYSVVSFDYTGNYAAASGETQVEYALMRQGNEGVTFYLNIEKITITEISDLGIANGAHVGSVTLDYNDGVTPEGKVDVKNTGYTTLPTPTREGYIFAGWYDTAKTNIKSELNIPVAFVGGSAYVGKTYQAAWVKEEVRRTEFTESGYSSITAGHGSNGTASGAWVVDTATGIAKFSAPGDDNDYKISLLDENGSKYSVYEGMTYKVSIRYKRTADESKFPGIGITRNSLGSFMPHGTDTVGSGFTRFVDAATAMDNFDTVTKEVTIKNSYVASNSIVEGGAANICLELSLCAEHGYAEVDWVEIEPIGYTPIYENETDKGTVTVDYATSTVTVAPKAGYEFKAGSLTTQMLYRNWSYTSSAETSVAAVSNNAIKLNQLAEKTADGYTFKFDFSNYAADFNPIAFNSVKFAAEFVEEGTTNAGYIAISTRDEKGAGADYQSAGIRYLTRVSAANVAAAEKIEYILVPKQELAEKQTIADYVAADGKYQFKGTVKDSATSIVYGNVGEDYVDYQAVLVGLTREGVANNLCNVEFKVALAITVGGATQYVEYADAYSYNTVQ